MPGAPWQSCTIGRSGKPWTAGSNTGCQLAASSSCVAAMSSVASVRASKRSTSPGSSQRAPRRTGNTLPANPWPAPTWSSCLPYMSWVHSQTSVSGCFVCRTGCICSNRMAAPRRSRSIQRCRCAGSTRSSIMCSAAISVPGEPQSDSSVGLCRLPSTIANSASAAAGSRSCFHCSSRTPASPNKYDARSKPTASWKRRLCSGSSAIVGSRSIAMSAMPSCCSCRSAQMMPAAPM